MKIGIISDTHDDKNQTQKAIEIFRREKISLVIHLGDWVSPQIVRLFKGLKLIAIFGNNDGYKYGLMKAFNEIGADIKGDFAVIKLEELKIALYHGEFRDISEALAKSGQYDLVLVGHFHKWGKNSFGKTLLLSPGTPHLSFTKDQAPTVGIFDTKTKDFKQVEV